MDYFEPYHSVKMKKSPPRKAEMLLRCKSFTPPANKLIIDARQASQCRWTENRHPQQ